MYTLEELQSKTFGELKKIGCELNVFPAAARRRRQNWIDAIAGINPPLLQLLETSPAEDVQAQESPIIETVKAAPPADDVQAQEPPIESKFGRIVYPRPAQKAIVPAVGTSLGVEVDRVQGAIETTETQSKFDCPTCKAVGSLHIARDCCLEMWIIQCLHCDYRRPMNPSSAYLSVPDPALDLFGIFPFKDDLLRRLELHATEANEFPAPAHTRFRVGDLVKSAAQRWGINPDLTGEVVLLHPSGGVLVDFVSGGLFDYSRFQSKDLIRLEPIEEVQAPEPIEQAVKNSPGVEVEQAQEPRAPVTENSPGVEVDRVQGAIVPATKNSSGVDRSQERIEDCFDLEELWELDHADCPACGGIDSYPFPKVLLQIWLLK